MSVGVVRSLDLVAVAAAVVAAVMAAVYGGVMRAQDDQPLAWVLVILVGAALAASYGASVRARHRRVALLGAGVALALLGLVAILSIGLPILVAGGLALVAGLRDVTRAADDRTRSAVGHGG